MAIVRYDPWNTLRQIQGDLDRMFGQRGPLAADEAESAETAGQWLPAVDISEDEKAYHIHADLPGVAPEDIEISMDQGVLAIKGSRESESTESEQGWKRVERARGTFYRRFSLPESVDAENIEARSRNGVLEVTVPKKVAPPAQRIEVKAE
ncbi:heat shock protein Hsp20 [Alkalispirillum mobile]|uniref:Heat shock protein Hsp20 n=1 Tax=Alkalispirillum mobile TaxID=85925 RepID=A0A498C8H7_9GAMM|nr:Hsp20/alpha crystallin family protein [Alkalispirillum mobile]RLK51437.1 heat shock protein Hsp20 [Alkalispirillum mobile]